jgi:hypothetical protein
MTVHRLDAIKPEFLRDFPWKVTARCAITTNVTIATALNAGDSIDGVTLAAGDRVMLMGQSTGSENGLYVVGPTPVRSEHMCTGLDTLGSVIVVLEGTANGGKVFKNTNAGPITIDTTALTFAEFGAGSGASLPWFNVEDYGAVHDGTTDDTAAVQAAIDACMAAGGGTVFFPNGIYAINGALQSTSTYNSQLTIPQNVYSGGSNGPIAIGFVGMGPAGQWNHGTSGPWEPGTSGAILLSNWAGTISNVPAVIAAGRYDATYPAASFNWIEVTFRNIEVRCQPNPKLSGIQMAAVASLSLENVTVSTDTDSASMAAPSNTKAYGIHCPLKINVNPPGILYNVFVDGFYTGITIAEVVHGINVSVHHCIVGVECAGPQNHGASFDRLIFVGVKTCMKFTGGIFFINVWSWIEEYKTSGTFPRVYDIDDASNYGRGFIAHQIQDWSGPAGQAITVNGGSHLSFYWPVGQEWKLNSVVEIPTGTDPSSNPATGGKLYAASATGHPTWRDSAGTVTDLLAGSGAPTTADYLVGTAQGGLSAEIVVGTSPGGELGGTWASPTVDATHAGSTHIALSSATPLVESGSGSAGSGTAASKDDHVHPAAGGGGGGHILITDTPAGSPLVFADLLQNDAGTDLLYADV